MTQVLLVVAHPDDDVIFGGPLQIANRQMQWQAVSVSYGAADPRAGEMTRWQKHVGGRIPRFLGFRDNPEDIQSRQSSFTAAEVAAALRLLPFQPDLIVTHDLAGEYGHPHHVITAQAVREVWAETPLIAFAHYRSEASFTVEVREFLQPALAIYASQKEVIYHLHQKLNCCRRGSYFVERGAVAHGLARGPRTVREA